MQKGKFKNKVVLIQASSNKYWRGVGINIVISENLHEVR
jgi:hypothetical protein